MQERILILDFGSQYTQLIARRVRELNVYSEIIPWNAYQGLPEGCKGVILSGSPHSVRDAGAPDPELWVMCLCLGCATAHSIWPKPKEARWRRATRESTDGRTWRN